MNISLATAEKVSMSFNIAIELVVLSLGSDFFSAYVTSLTTVTEARKAHASAPNKSDAQKIALIKWEELSLNEAQVADNITDIKEAYRSAPTKGMAKKAAMEKWCTFITTTDEAKSAYYSADTNENEIKLTILQKWKELSMIQVLTASTVIEAKEAYKSLPTENPLGGIALAKWEELSLAGVKAATTIAEIKEAYQSTPSNGQAKKAAMGKWCSLITTIAEVKEAYALTLNKDDLRRMVLKKWYTMVITLKEITDIYESLSNGDGLVEIVLNRWCDLINTVDEARDALSIISKTSCTFKDSIERKWKSLFTIQIEATTTVTQIKDIYNSGSDEAKKIALVKWEELSLTEVQTATTITEVKTAYQFAPNKSEAQKIAIQKLYALS